MRYRVAIAAFLTAFTAAFGGAKASPDQFHFARTYKEGTVTRNVVEMQLPGGIGDIAAHISSKVLSVNGAEAKVSYEMTKMDSPAGYHFADTVPPLTSEQGPIGIADSATIRNGQKFIVFLGLAGITPNQTVKIGDTVAAHWAGTNGDVKVDGQGKIEKVSSDGSLLTVTWDLTMTASNMNSGTWHLTSVYRTSDFSLDHAEGTLEIGEHAMHVKMGVEE